MKTDLSGEFQLVSAGRMAPSVLHEVVGVIGELLLLDRLCKFVCSYLIRNPYPALFHSKGALSVSNQALSHFHQAKPMMPTRSSALGKAFVASQAAFAARLTTSPTPGTPIRWMVRYSFLMRLDWSVVFLSKEF
jgi:hypothetical protein